MKDPGVNGRKETQILKIGTAADSCEHGNEPLGSIKCREFLYHLTPCYFSKKDCLETINFYPLTATACPPTHQVTVLYPLDTGTNVRGSGLQLNSTEGQTDCWLE
jgi:hypothetical protein